MDEQTDVMRHYRKDLLGLSADGSPCEQCNLHMHDHEWADLDVNGFVVRCCFQALKDLPTQIMELHADSGEKVKHWCQHFGGSMESNHEADAPNYCDECGPETAWPCNSFKIAQKALGQDDQSR